MHGPKRETVPCVKCGSKQCREIYSGNHRALGRQCIVCFDFIQYAPEDDGDEQT